MNIHVLVLYGTNTNQAIYQPPLACVERARESESEHGREIARKSEEERVRAREKERKEASERKKQKCANTVYLP